MPEQTLTPKEGVDTTRLDVLASNENRTPEENKEFAELRTTLDKEKSKEDVQRRMDELTGKTKLAEHKFDQSQVEIDRLRVENETLKNKPAEPVVSRETVEVGGKQFFTDTALRTMIDAGKMTEQEAFSHQQDRVGEVAADKAYNRIKEEDTKTAKQTQYNKGLQSILTERPEFDNRSPNHNPSDPLFKKTAELMQGGLMPDFAFAQAKLMFPKTPTVDNTDNLSLHSPTAPNATDPKAVVLSEDMQELAIRTYRDQTNPATGRTYTNNESIAKYKKAMESRKSHFELRRRQ